MSRMQKIFLSFVTSTQTAKITEPRDAIGHPERVSAVVPNECEWQGRGEGESGEGRERGKEIRSAMLRREGKKEGTFDT